LKNKIQVFESGWSVFASIWYFLKKNIDVVNILVLFFWLMEFIFFITKIIPNLMKSDIIVGDTFGVLFEVEMI
jgi:hypothetical protein